MTVRYVGPGGSDAASGLTWALRKETLNGVEDTPVVAGDIIYVGPGVYRETLTGDIDGTLGNIILYIGDVTGENTDGVGGKVRISGSDDDLSETRSRAIDADLDYRTFRGFTLDSTISDNIEVLDATNTILEDCVFVLGSRAYRFSTSLNIIVRRCIFWHCSEGASIISNLSDQSSDYLLENCLVFGGAKDSMAQLTNEDQAIVKNNSFLDNSWASDDGIIFGSAGGGAVNEVRDCVIRNQRGGITWNATAPTVSHIGYQNVQTDKPGSTVVDYVHGITVPLLYAGIRVPWTPYTMDQKTDSIRIAHNTTPTEDVFGVARPTTAVKLSRGAQQYEALVPDTQYVRSGNNALQLPDAQRSQLFVLVRDTSKRVTVSLFVYREGDYAGTLPEIVIKRVGQSDATVTDTGGASAWNKLTYSFNPTSADNYFVLELVSNNTALTGFYKTVFDQIEVRNTGKLGFTFIHNYHLLIAPLKSKAADTWVAPTVPPLEAGPIGQSSGVYPPFHNP